MRRSILTLAATLTLALAAPAAAQEEADVPEPLEIGVMAPDFEMTGATRHGILAEPVRLSDYRGETVVLAFFFKARTRG